MVNPFIMRTNQYCVYIMANKHKTTLYTGVTNNLIRRVIEHKEHKTKGFTNLNNVIFLVYYEFTNDIEAAILREKQIKVGSRSKKIELIEKMNPEWRDLFQDLMDG
jgi:putative endonuclease